MFYKINKYLQCALGEGGKQKLFPFHSGSKEIWKKHMLEKFPNEEVALDKYLAKLKVCPKDFDLILKIKTMHIHVPIFYCLLLFIFC